MKSNLIKKRLPVYINVISLFFFVWYFFIHVGIDVYYQKYIKPKETFLDDVYYKAKVNSFAGLNVQLDSEVEYDLFVGDSLIEQFPVNELFYQRNSLNRGLGFDTTVGVLRRHESNINNINIARFFLMIGYNDLKYRNIEETYINIEQILSKTKARNKYFINILPSADSKHNEKVRQLNKKIKTLSRESNFEYINSHQFFIRPDGSIRSEYYYDGVHLNIAGYLQLTEAIKSFLED